MTLLFNRRKVACLLAGTGWRLSSPRVPGRPNPSTGPDYVKLGGIEQWISIKGEDATNPVLLVVHGGPADVQWPNADKYVPWQKSSRWCNGTSAARATHTAIAAATRTPEVNLDRIVKDGIELAEYLVRDRKKKEDHPPRPFLGLRGRRADGGGTARTFRRLCRHRPGRKLGLQCEEPIRHNSGPRPRHQRHRHDQGIGGHRHARSKRYPSVFHLLPQYPLAMGAAGSGLACPSAGASRGL